MKINRIQNSMKKLLLFASIGLMGAMLYADYRETPRGPSQALASADYGGVDVATASFTTNYSTACSQCSGVFYAVGFSSGPASSAHFTEVFDVDFASNAVIYGSGTAIARLYNKGESSSTISAGYFSPPKPIRFWRGLQFRTSVADYNLNSILYHKNQ